MLITQNSILTSEIEPSIFLITINRPEKANTIDDNCIDILEHTIDEIKKTKIKAIIITSAGEKIFCAGADLSLFQEKHNSQRILSLSSRMTKLLDNLWLGNIPVIAAINGKAFGGGLEILSACHIKIAIANAEFAFRQARMGVTTGWGGAKRLFATLAENTLLYHFLSGESFNAKQAKSMQFIQKTVNKNVLSEAVNIAQTIAALEYEVILGFMDLYKKAMKKSDKQIDKKFELNLFSSLIGHGFFFKNAENFIKKRQDQET